MLTKFDHHHLFLSLFSLLHFLLPLISSTVTAVGVCYGRVANNLPPTAEVANVLKANDITSIRLFDADPSTLKAFAGTGIKLMIGVPNEILPSLASGATTASLDWLLHNVFAYIPPDNIQYIAVGNEVFLKDPYYTPHVVPTILNIYHALQTLGLAETIKLSSPQAASILSSSYPPSSGAFDPYHRPNILSLLQFLRDSNSVFMVNVYPYISYTNNKDYVSLDYALFRAKNMVQDGSFMYDNLFDASIDALINAMEREGFPEIPVVVAETGWPTSGGEAASIDSALAYNENVVRRALNSIGTPRRPGKGVEVYLFDLFDENGKNGEEYEKHFGIFRLDGMKVYNLNFK